MINELYVDQMNSNGHTVSVHGRNRKSDNYDNYHPTCFTSSARYRIPYRFRCLSIEENKILFENSIYSDVLDLLRLPMLLHCHFSRIRSYVIGIFYYGQSTFLRSHHYYINCLEFILRQGIWHIILIFLFNT